MHRLLVVPASSDITYFCIVKIPFLVFLYAFILTQKWGGFNGFVYPFYSFPKGSFSLRGEGTRSCESRSPLALPSWLRSRLFRWREKRGAIAEDNVNSRSVPLTRRLGLIIWHIAEKLSTQDYIDSGSNSANWQSIHTILSRPDAHVEFF